MIMKDGLLVFGSVYEYFLPTDQSASQSSAAHGHKLWQIIMCHTPRCLPLSARTWYLVRLNGSLAGFVDDY